MQPGLHMMPMTEPAAGVSGGCVWCVTWHRASSVCDRHKELEGLVWHTIVKEHCYGGYGGCRGLIHNLKSCPIWITQRITGTGLEIVKWTSVSSISHLSDLLHPPNLPSPNSVILTSFKSHLTETGAIATNIGANKSYSSIDISDCIAFCVWRNEKQNFIFLGFLKEY